jgi:hypothetical protein
MKLAVLAAIVVVCLMGIGYVYVKCPSLNNCFNNSSCVQDCYEDGKRVR